MTSAQTVSFASSTVSTTTFTYEVPIDPMDELHCESCQ